jgi:hypothetical protein
MLHRAPGWRSGGGAGADPGIGESLKFWLPTGGKANLPTVGFRFSSSWLSSPIRMQARSLISLTQVSGSMSSRWRA